MNFVDNFSASNGTSLTTYGYTASSGAAGTPTINSNQVSGESTTNGYWIPPSAATPTTTSYNVSASINGTGQGASLTNLYGYLNGDGTTCYILILNHNNNALTLRKSVAGVTTDVTVANGTPSGAGAFTAELRLRPGFVVALINGVVVATVVDSTVAVTPSTTAALGMVSTGSANLDHISQFGISDLIKTIAPNDPSLAGAFTPLQWNVTAARAAAIVGGSKMKLTFTGTSIAVNLDNSQWNIANYHISGSNKPLVRFSVDSGDEAIYNASTGYMTSGYMIPTPIGSTGKFNTGGCVVTSTNQAFAMANLSNGTHTLTMTYMGGNFTGTNIPSYPDWNDDGSGNGPPAAIRVTGIVVDVGATVASALPAGNLFLIVADSIGATNYADLVSATAAGSTAAGGDPETCWTFDFAESLGYTTVRLCYPGTGYTDDLSSTRGPATQWITNWSNGVPLSFNGTGLTAANVSGMAIMLGQNDNLHASPSAIATAAQSVYSQAIGAFPSIKNLIAYSPLSASCNTTNGTSGASNAPSGIATAVAALANPVITQRSVPASFVDGLPGDYPGYPTISSNDGTHPNTPRQAVIRGFMTADVASVLSVPSGDVIASASGVIRDGGGYLPQSYATATGAFVK